MNSSAHSVIEATRQRIRQYSQRQLRWMRQPFLYSGMEPIRNYFYDNDGVNVNFHESVSIPAGTWTDDGPCSHLTESYNQWAALHINPRIVYYLYNGGNTSKVLTTLFGSRQQSQRFPPGIMCRA